MASIEGLGLVACGAGLLALASGCGGTTRAQDRAEAPVVRVQTEPVRDARVSRPVRATGVLIDDTQLELGFASAGVVQRVLVDEGERFDRGDVLARLDLDAIDAQVAQAAAGRVRAERDVARLARLADTGAAPTQPLDDARTGLDVARATERGAAFARRHAVLIAPGDGIVLRRLADPMETVGAGAPVLVVAMSSAGRVARVAVTDRDVVRLRAGDVAELALDAFPDRDVAATIRRVSLAPSQQTGLFDVELAVSDDALRDRLVAGLVVRAVIHPSDAEARTLVPLAALIEADEARAVLWRMDGTRPVRTEVHVAFLLGEDAVLREPLTGSVVTVGAAYVRDGVRIEVLPSAAAHVTPRSAQ